MRRPCHTGRHRSGSNEDRDLSRTVETGAPLEAWRHATPVAFLDLHGPARRYSVSPLRLIVQGRSLRNETSRRADNARAAFSSGQRIARATSIAVTPAPLRP